MVRPRALSMGFAQIKSRSGPPRPATSERLIPEEDQEYAHEQSSNAETDRAKLRTRTGQPCRARYHKRDESRERQPQTVKANHHHRGPPPPPSPPRQEALPTHLSCQLISYWRRCRPGASRALRIPNPRRAGLGSSPPSACAAAGRRALGPRRREGTPPLRRVRKAIQLPRTACPVRYSSWHLPLGGERRDEEASGQGAEELSPLHHWWSHPCRPRGGLTVCGPSRYFGCFTP